jgi:glycosyltransferase involved in cell wall biosynthesis
VYTQESGEPGGFHSQYARNVFHAVFPQPKHHSHGHRYAFISKWLSEYCSLGDISFVPYIVKTPNSLILKKLGRSFREKYNIPFEAKVFGRIGSYFQFNIDFVLETVIKVLDKDPNIYFIFCNTKNFFNHPRIIYIPAVYDEISKYSFIAASDAMIHARQRGETFGLAVAEFSSCNKPVITYLNSPEKAHIQILDKLGLYYENKNDLEDLLLNYKIEDKNYNAYTEYNPGNVIKIFEQVFLK